MMVPSEGVLGTAEQWHPLPTQALSLDRFQLRREVILDLEPGQVQNLPKYKRGELPDTTNPQWDETILGYWEGILSPETDLVLRRRRAARPHPSGRPQAVLLSDFLGFEIRNPLGQPLGRVRDLMIDLDQARVEFAVLSFAETTGEEDRLYPVTFGYLELDIPFSGILMEADAPLLHQAPSFDTDSWPPLLEEQNWAEQARSFWFGR
jgi:sporulation protein YlmC with PRC-barrel domain